MYFQEEGLEVHAIDNSPLAIEVCRLRGVISTQVLSIECVDKLPSKYDCINILGNNLGLLGSREGAGQILNKLSSIVNDNGIIIGEMLDPYLTSDPYHLEYHAFNRRRNRYPGQIGMRIRYKKAASDWMDYLFVSLEELKELLKNSHWTIDQVINGSPSYAVILRKKVI